MNKLAVLEGLLFIVGDDGLNLKQISEILEISEDETKKLLSELQKEYEKDSRGIRVSFLGNAFKLTTKKEHNDYYKRLVKDNNSNYLSQAALETLAVIAYNQPITRVEIDELRGISSSFLIKKLMAKDLITVAGKSNLPGKPNLYKTTTEFLDYFGLSSLSELPDIKLNVSDNDDNVDLYQSTYKEK